jgi:hypothetical protein
VSKFEAKNNLEDKNNKRKQHANKNESTKIEIANEENSNLSLIESEQLGGCSQASETQRADAILGLQQTQGNTFIQRMIGDGGSAVLDDEILQKIQSEKGYGEAISSEIRHEMESSFKRELGDVRLHTSPEADLLAKQLGAKAFTTGNDIFFRNGAYQPSTLAGKKLMKHELIHTVQQSQASDSQPSRISQPGEQSELEAEKASESNIPVLSASGSAPVIARVPDDADSILLNMGVGFEQFEKYLRNSGYYEEDPEIEYWMEDQKNWFRQLGYSF